MVAGDGVFGALTDVLQEIVDMAQVFPLPVGFARIDGARTEDDIGKAVADGEIGRLVVEVGRCGQHGIELRGVAAQFALVAKERSGVGGILWYTVKNAVATGKR